MVWYFPEIRFLYIYGYRQPVYQLIAYLAALVGALLVLYYLRREKESYKHIVGAAIASVVGVVFGARLFYYFGPWPTDHGIEWTFVEKFVRFIQFWGDGLVLYGGLLGGILFLYLYIRWQKLDVGKYMDVAAVVFPITLSIARLGCVFANDHPEKQTTLPWGVIRYGDPGVLPFNLTGGASTWTSSKIVHPSLFYYLLFMIILSVLMVYLYRRRKRLFTGDLLVFALLFYAVNRIFNETFRIYKWHIIIYKNKYTLFSYLFQLFQGTGERIHSRAK